MKKILLFLVSILCISVLVSCQTKAIDKNGEELKIDKKDYEEYDFSKMSWDERKKAFSECFDITYKYDGLPAIVSNNGIGSVMPKSSLGSGFVKDFCESNQPYLIYKAHVSLKDGCLYDYKNVFSVKVFEVSYGIYVDKQNIGMNSGTDISLQLRSDNMPKERSMDAWNRTLIYARSYRSDIDKTIDEIKDRLEGIDISSMSGKIYKAK